VVTLQRKTRRALACCCACLIFWVDISAAEVSPAEPSQCFGSTSNGTLKNGVALPRHGDNFSTYSSLAHVLGRTYVHSTVKHIVLQAYEQLSHSHPDTVFVYGETGFKEGGEFKPHKTHRNGLSVDFMVPVVDKQGVSRPLPTHPLNKFGYDIEFDGQGQFEGLTIDYAAMAAHIAALHRAALQSGVDIWRVIFDPQLQPYLFDTAYGPYLQKHTQFSTRSSWVRHDEHYHVDFAVPCSP